MEKLVVDLCRPNRPGHPGHHEKVIEERGMSFDKRLLRNYGKRVDFSGQPRNFPGGGILMKNTLGMSLLY